MVSITTINYADIYPGPKPSVETLLKGINSKIIVVLMAVISAELHSDEDATEIQQRLTRIVTAQFSEADKALLKRGLELFSLKLGNHPMAIWGKRYAREMIKQAFLHYQEGDSINTTPEEEVRIFKAYLLTAERMNERDRHELSKIRSELDNNDTFFFEKMVWPFALNQFDTNNIVHPGWEFVRLLSLISYSLSDPELLDTWKKFIRLNGFQSLSAYLGSTVTLMDITQRRFPDKPYKVFSWINAKDIPDHLLNLSFDKDEYLANVDKQVEYRGLKEKPLYRTSEQEFVALDVDYLNNKVYNGLLFDLFYQTNMAGNTRFKQFPDFKTNVGSAVSETIVFRKLLSSLFQTKNTLVHFDDEDNDANPDCYIRWKNNIFIFECKDNLLPAKLVESFSFDEIKKHIDEKFIRNQRGKKKGITQILSQIKTIGGDKFSFDQFSLKQKINIYPVIVHTNFMYRMPGVNHYLDRAFKEQLTGAGVPTNIRVADLTVIDLQTFFNFLYLQDMNVGTFESFLLRYSNLLKERQKRFQREVNQDNFLRARSSFDEIYFTLMEPKHKRRSTYGMMQLVMEIFGFDQDMVNAF